jgi:hypothetical protein
VAIACGIGVLAVVFAVLLEQVVLAQSAFKMAGIRERLVAAETRHHELLLDAAKLESSDRIERYARDVLGMVKPQQSTLNYIVADVRVPDHARLVRKDRLIGPAGGQAAAEEAP